MTNTFKMWIYHATKEPKIIDSEALETMQAQGWADSPAEFMDLTVVGLDLAKIAAGDKEEIAKAQQAKDAIEGVKESLNGQLNLSQMSKSDAIEYAHDHLGLEIDKKKTKNTIIKEIKKELE